MNPLRAIAQHYAKMANPIVPAERFTEGHRGQLDVLPAIIYQRSSEPEDFHQTGPGHAELNVTMTIWATTPGQAGRIRDQLRDHFHLISWTTIGDGADAFLCKFCQLDTTVDVSEYPQDGSADFANNSTCYFVFTYAPAVPAHMAPPP